MITEITRNHDLRIIDVVQFNRPPASRPVDVRPKPRPQYGCEPRPIHCGTGSGHHGQVNQQSVYDDYGYYNDDNEHYGDSHGNLYDDDYNSLSAYELESLLQDLTAAWNDSDRLKLASEAIRDNRIRTEQVVQILDSFWYEENRLEFALLAYDRVTDPENYELVNDVFWFSSSVSELEDYINSSEYSYNH